MLALDARVERLELGVRRLQAHAGLEPCDRLDEMRASRVLRKVPDEPLVDVDTRRKVESRIHHAQDRMKPAVELNGAANDVRIARVTCSPQAIADHDGGRIRDVQRVGSKAGAELRPNAQHLEEIRADFDGVHTDRILTLIRQVQVGPPPTGGVLEDLRQPAVVQKGNRRQRLVGQTARWLRVPDHHEAFGIRIREGPQDHRVEDTEDGSARANAQPQCEHRGQGEGRTSDEHPQTESDVLEKPVHVV